jgi:hypothetical protein
VCAIINGVVTRKYRLDPLRRVREENVDREVRALSGSLRQIEAARDEAERAEARQRELEASMATTTAAEGQLLGRGALTAADLARGAAWKIASEMERGLRGQATEHARARLDAAEMDAVEHRRDLAEAKAKEELVSQHHDAWLGREKAASEARDEEDAEQAHLALRGQRGEK